MIRILAAGLALLSATACSATTTEARTEDPSPTASQKTSGPADGIQPTTVVDKAPVSIVASVPVGYDGPLAASPRFVVTARGSDTAILRRPLRGDSQPVARLLPSMGYELGTVHIDGRTAIWSETSAGDDASGTRLVAQRLPNGSPTLVSEMPGALELGLPPVWTVNDGMLAFATQDGQATNCIATAPVRTMRATIAFCTKRKRDGAGSPSISNLGLVLNTWTPEPKPLGCVRLLVRPQGSDEFTPVNGVERTCRVWSGERGADFTLWGEQHGYTPSVASYFARTDDGSLYNLGVGDTGKHVTCAGRVYWVSYQGEDADIRTWTPDGPVRVIYRNSQRWLSLSTPVCADDHLYVRRFPNGAGREQLIEVDVGEAG